MKRYLPLLFTFWLTSCAHSCEQVPNPMPGAQCPDVCANMVKLDCPAAKPTAKGATCEQVCVNFQTSGLASWNLGCRATALTCAAADACEAK